MRYHDVGHTWSKNNFIYALFAEHIDRKEAAKRGIKVGYTPDVLTDAG